LILLGALGATTLVLRAGDRIEVVKVTKQIEAGESVGDSNVTSVMVAADDSIHYVKWSQLGALKQLKAKSTIYAGTVVIGDMFAEGSSLPAGKAAVGVALKEGQYPADIKSGDVVAVYNVDTSSSGSGKTGSGAGSTTSGGGAIVDTAKVERVADNSDATVSTGNLSVTLLVDQADAAAVARAASASAVAIVHVSGTGN
jgi:CxxC motif-containing protein